MIRQRKSSSFSRLARGCRGALLVTLGLFLTLAAGCGSSEGESAHAGYDIGTTGEALSTKCGANKYSSVQGADVSAWQESFNWKAQKNSGMDFGFARVSHGLGYIDSYFPSNWKKMKAAGILRGAYQYFDPGQSATKQAELMVKKVGKLGKGDLPCVIDVEMTGGQSPSTIAKKVKTWLNIVEKGTGKKPIIYTGAYFWQDNVKSTGFGGYKLWIAAYGPSCPSLPSGWKNWTFWQYCDGQKQYCKNGQGFDRDVFNGSKAELLKLAGGEKSLKAKSVRKWSNAHRYHGKKADYIACAGKKVKMSFTFRNVGTAVWRDVKGRGKNAGSDVYLVTANGKKDRITKHKRYSVKLNKNRYVRGDHKAKNCSNKNGCRKTTFIKGAMSGTAPNQPGIYHSRWRLRDYSKAWGKHSKGFGPKVDLKLKVISCEAPKQHCGCRVWCSDGKSHDLAASIDSAAACKSVGQTYCKPDKLLSQSFESCAAPPAPPAPTTPPSGGSGAPGSGGAGGADPGAGAAGDPGYGGAAGAGGVEETPAEDEGEESEPNGIPTVTEETDEDVEDDADFSDDGFTGDEDALMEDGGGCSVAPGGNQSHTPLGAGFFALALVLAEARRRRARRTC